MYINNIYNRFNYTHDKKKSSWYSGADTPQLTQHLIGRVLNSEVEPEPGNEKINRVMIRVVSI